MRFGYKILTLMILINFAPMDCKATTGINSEDRLVEAKIDNLIKQMTLQEKIGQLALINVGSEQISTDLRGQVVDGTIGSVLNAVNVEICNELQRVAVKESRLGIPLLIARDVIHGFRTIFPIPLGLAATWNPQLIEKGARIAAIEASSVGIRWTFAPMIDISRDPRWGRIAESFGEDPFLVSAFSTAMVRGFQGDDLSQPDALAACAKHFAGYGAAEGGRDYNTTYIPEGLLREVYLRPFKAAKDAGVATFMTGFNEINGMPATGSEFLLRDILRQEWGFRGFVVSDWSSITEMIAHGFCANKEEAALRAIRAGVDMEMSSFSYRYHLSDLLRDKKITLELIDDTVRNILRVKFQLGLFDNPYTDPSKFPQLVNDKHLEAAKESAVQSIVMLKNKEKILPLSKKMGKVAIIGPLADDRFEQLGTWTFDKKIEDTVTPLSAISNLIGSSKVTHIKTLENTRSTNTNNFQSAIKAANEADAVLLFLGEEAILSGEAHCRANIDLPGAQEKLIDVLSRTGKPIILTIMAGRPLTITRIVDKVDAILYAWQPGTMGGPAIADIVFGIESPSAKLPVTFPKMVGQIPLYYNHKNTGRPAKKANWVHIDDIPVRAVQTSLGNESHYLDAGFTPLYPFGYGLSYTQFEYDNLTLSANSIRLDETLNVSADIRNTGNFEAEEIVQLYIRDMAADVTRPVKELKGFQRIRLKAGEMKKVSFTLDKNDLAFCNSKMEFVTETGKFQVWIAENSQQGLLGEFEVVN